MSESMVFIRLTPVDGEIGNEVWLNLYTINTIYGQAEGGTIVDNGAAKYSIVSEAPQEVLRLMGDAIDRADGYSDDFDFESEDSDS